MSTIQKSAIGAALTLLILIAGGAAIFVGRTPRPPASAPVNSAPVAPAPQPVEYQNAVYGLSVSLPDGWRGYSILNGTWEGLAVGENGEMPAATGPELSVRHPQWTELVPRQDIPIMVFTIEQWDRLQQDKFHIGAAPIGPSELGRNAKYVFALPARYNFAFPVGFEEVDALIQGKPLKTFDPAP